MQAVQTRCVREESIYKKRAADYNRNASDRRKILAKKTKIFVEKTDIVDVSAIIGEKNHWRESAEHFQAELDRDEAVLLYAEIMREHEELLAEHKAVKAAAKFRENIGRPLAELAPRQARRKRAEFKSKAAAALWFAKSFGIEIKSLEAVDDNNEKVVFRYDDKEDDDDRAVQVNPSAAVATSDQYEKRKRRFLSLPAEEQDKIWQLLYLVNRFRISDEFIHEQSMIFKEMPRSYLVTTAEDMLDNEIRERYVRCNWTHANHCLLLDWLS